jgi:AcrR family transcriptional regulator
MPTRKNDLPANTGRKSAYVARNRAALLRSTQGVLAEIGPTATIDQVSEAAGLSVSTIYKHFETKELLFQTAIGAAMIDWQQWVDQFLVDITDPLEELVLPARLIMRIGQSHPLYADLAAQNLQEIARYIPEVGGGLSKHVRELAKAKVINIENLEIRVESFSAVLFSTLSHQLLNPKAKASDADIAIEVALTLLGIAPAKAKKLAHKSLPQFAAGSTPA